MSFDLSDGEYTFRANDLGYQFWCQIYTIHDTLSATLSIPHQDIAITVENLYGTQKNRGNGIPVYLFKPALPLKIFLPSSFIPALFLFSQST